MSALPAPSKDASSSTSFAGIAAWSPGSSAVGVNIDLISHVDWWEHPDFTDDDHRHAAEMIAFDVLDPALRSRGNPRKSAKRLSEDAAFREEMVVLFHGPPTGRFLPPRIGDLAAELRDLTKRVAAIEADLQRLLGEEHEL
jgi:hypothetical protein